ncbi:MAG: hypothetical protein IT361_14385 [Gemmatimonadaceae bacterium]|nr:hypothetical protein [Gemmatimonadaceae bacterium]
MRDPSIVCLAALALFAATPAGAQVRERRLGASREAAAAYSDISAARVLSDGRILVYDAKEQALHLVDLERGTQKSLGSVGSGPGEFRRATALLPARGDTTWLVDAGNRRLLVVAPDGSLPATVTAPEGVPLAQAGGGDGAGNLVAVTAMFEGSTFAGKAPDSVRLVRVNVASLRVTPVTPLAAPQTKIHIKQTGTRIESVEVVRMPFAVGEPFGVAPGGRVAIARRAPYRLDQVMADGRVVRGPVIPVTSIPVGDAEREEYLATLLRRPAPEALEWPETLPPFPPQSVVALANGETWVRRHVTARRDSTWYDILDARGAAVARLVLPKRVRILTVTARGAYVARADDDGLVHLELAAVR